MTTVSENKTVIPIERIMEMIPHRFPFLMIDRVIDMVPNSYAIGLKNVTINENHFTGHFPTKPVMPGVLLIEAMAQTSAVLVVETLGKASEGKLVYFMSIDEARFRKPVVPGDTVHIRADKQHSRRNVWKFACVATVEGAKVAEATISAMILGLTMAHIHPTAVIGPGVSLGNNISIGAFCVLEGHVTLGDNCVLKSHVTISGHTTIGKDCTIYPFASIGHAPQDLKYKGEPVRLIIGDGNTIREHVTMNPGTEGGGGVTTVGNHCLFMVSAHVAHDCKIGNHVILVNHATLGGHVEIGDHAIIGGLSAVHQFVRIGAHAMIGGMSGVEHDVIPYGSVMGERANLAGLNLVGLKRRGFERDTIHALRSVYKLIFEETRGTLAERAGDAKTAYGTIPAVEHILRFIDDKGSRSLCVPKGVQAA